MYKYHFFLYFLFFVFCYLLFVSYYLTVSSVFEQAGTIRFEISPAFSKLYCTVLYCIVLYCTVLYWTVLYCIVLDWTVLYCTILYAAPWPLAGCTREAVHNRGYLLTMRMHTNRKILNWIT